MRFITIDFETYYDSEYTLTKMSTEDYVNDPRFEVILVGIKIGNEKPYWITGTTAQLKAHFDTLNLHECAVLAHNMAFDGLILAVHFGIYPAMYCDTLDMAQVYLKPYHRSISLKNCLIHIGAKTQKGDEVERTRSMTRSMFSREALKRYAAYCMDDCDGEYELFKYLLPMIPRDELEIIDITRRMYLQPRLLLDSHLMALELAETKAKKLQALNSLPEGLNQADMMSNAKFAAALELYDVEVPTKISPTTGLITFAFAKTDTGWKELEEEWSDDPIVSSILAARISAKSTLEESRYQRLLDISLKYECFRIPLRYYAAHTGRYGGTEGINAQNFPRSDKSRMRFGIRAPKGYVVMAPDLSQIEARITAWLARQMSLIKGFANKEDIYSVFASMAFGIETIKGRSKDDDRRRFVGKTCILGLGFGMGWKRLRATLRKDGIVVTEAEARRYVDTYRTLYPRIPALWHFFDEHLEIMAMGQGQVKVGPITLAKNSIILPNGMTIIYNNLRRIHTDKYKGWVYDFAGEVRTLWGGKVTENVAQALARIIIMEHMLNIKRVLKLIPVLQQHDELDYVVPEQYAEKVKAALGKLIRVPSSWASDLPVEVEINYGPTLGDCK